MHREKSVQLFVNPGTALLLSGRGRVEVRQGQVEIFGALLHRGNKFKVRLGRQLPLYSPDVRSTLIGEGFFRWTLLKEDPIPSSWRQLVDELLSKPGSTVVILGQTDSGKSALSQFLSNSMLNFSPSIGLIDADIGQSDVGPAGFISACLINKKVVDLRNLKPVFLDFVGALSPSNAFESSISGVIKAKNALEKHNPSYIIVNTDGWFDENGLQHKKALIEKLSPQIVIELYQKEGIFENKGNFKLIRVQSPAHTLKRSQLIRRLSRLANVIRFLKGAEPVAVKSGIESIDGHVPQPGDLSAVCEDEEVIGVGIYGGLSSDGSHIVYTRAKMFTKVLVSNINLKEVLDLIKSKLTK